MPMLQSSTALGVAPNPTAQVSLGRAWVRILVLTGTMMREFNQYIIQDKVVSAMVSTGSAYASRASAAIIPIGGDQNLSNTAKY